MNENRREFFRVFFNQSIEGQLAINGGEPFPIEIDDISVKGLKFLSDIDIPMQEKVICSFEIMDDPFVLEGAIVRKRDEEKGFEYGVGFSLDQSMSSHLFKQLNFYQIRQRKGILK
jgi:hypothetical protein